MNRGRRRANASVMTSNTQVRLLCALTPVLLLSFGGCETRRVVRGTPMLGSLPGAEVGAKIRPTEAGGSGNEGLVVDESEERLRIEHPDGTVTLVSRTGRQLMAHIFTTIDDDEGELFVEQVLSDMSKKEFAQRGVDPIEGFRYLQTHERAIRKLFNAIPMGEFTPGVFMKAQGDNVFRLEAPKLLHRQLAWTFMDMVFENGAWRLRWFG